MTERNKVIEALEACVLKDPDDSRDCRHCPRCNYGAFITNSCINGVMADALALLKAQKETIPIDFLMRYAQLPTEFAISTWKKPIGDALKKEAKDTDKPMSFDDALQLVNGILPINRSEER